MLGNSESYFKIEWFSSLLLDAAMITKSERFVWHLKDSSKSKIVFIVNLYSSSVQQLTLLFSRGKLLSPKST